MLRPLLAVTGKELRLFLRDPGALALTFAMPLMFIVVMSSALQGVFDPDKGNPIDMAVVNQDQGPQAARVIAQLRTMKAFRLQERWHGRPLDRRTAEGLVASGKRSVVLLFPPNFSRALEAPGTGSAAPPPEVARVQILVDPVTSLHYVEPIRGVVAGLLRQQAYLAAVPREIDALLDIFPLKLDAAGRKRIAVQARASLSPSRLGETAGRVTLDRTFPSGVSLSEFPDTFQQNVPGYAIFGVFWVVTLLASSVLSEKRQGTFRRLRVAPVSRAALLGGKLLPYLLIACAQLVIMLGAGHILYGLTLGHSLLGLVLVGLATAMAATSLGILVAALARTEAQASSLTTLFLLSLAALGGCFVPRFIMPDWLRSLSLATPHGWALDGFQDLIVRGQGLVDVLPELGALLAFSVLFFGVGVWRFSFDD